MKSNEEEVIGRTIKKDYHMSTLTGKTMGAKQDT